MDGFEAYKFANAVNLHFNSDYDCFKYHFKTRVSQKSYWGRPDKYQLTKIGKRFKSKDEIIRYFAAHQVAGNKWVGDMIRDEDVYVDYLKKIESLSYNFREELDQLSEYKLDDLLIIDINSNYPMIINKYLEDTVSLETICVLNSLTGFMQDADKKITETIMWPDLFKKVVKYEPFINFNNKKFVGIIFDVFGK